MDKNTINLEPVSVYTFIRRIMMINNKKICTIIFCFLMILLGIDVSKAVVNHDIKCDEENFIKVQKQRGEGCSLEGTGDYSKLKLIVRLEERRRGTVSAWIFPHFYLKNESDEEILLCASTAGTYNRFMENLSVLITDRDGNPVEKTLYGEKWFPCRGALQVWGYINVYGKLQPGKTIKIYSPEYPLSHYFDLSQSGQYQLIARLHQNIVVFDPPLESEPFSFRVRGTSVLHAKDLKQPGDFHDHSVIRHKEVFTQLEPAGEYSKLKYGIRLNKATYKAMEPVFIRTYVKNESEETCNVALMGHYFETSQMLCLIDSEGKPVPKTSLGKNKTPDEMNFLDWFLGYSHVKLEPGEEVMLATCQIQSERQLDRYFDLSLPGRYKLESFCTAVMLGQKFDLSLESNEVEFEIEARQYFDQYDLINPDGFNSPPEEL